MLKGSCTFNIFYHDIFIQILLFLCFNSGICIIMICYGYSFEHVQWDFTMDKYDFTYLNWKVEAAWYLQAFKAIWYMIKIINPAKSHLSQESLP